MHAIKCLDNEAMRSFKEFEKKLSFIGEGKRMVSWSSDEVEQTEGKVEKNQLLRVVGQFKLGNQTCQLLSEC